MTEAPVRYVMRVWFDTSTRRLKRSKYSARPWDTPVLEPRDGAKLTDFGAGVWLAPDGRPVYVWAVDHVVCGDTRWVMFGPFESRRVARRAVGSIRIKAAGRGIELLGYELRAEHCLIDEGGRGLTYNKWSGAASDGWPRHMYTDG